MQCHRTHDRIIKVRRRKRSDRRLQAYLTFVDHCVQQHCSHHLGDGADLEEGRSVVISPVFCRRPAPAGDCDSSFSLRILPRDCKDSATASNKRIGVATTRYGPGVGEPAEAARFGVMWRWCCHCHTMKLNNDEECASDRHLNSSMRCWWRPWHGR